MATLEASKDKAKDKKSPRQPAEADSSPSSARLDSSTEQLTSKGSFSSISTEKHAKVRFPAQSGTATFAVDSPPSSSPSVASNRKRPSKTSTTSGEEESESLGDTSNPDYEENEDPTTSASEDFAVEPQDMDLSRPVTNSREAKSTPRRYTPILRVVGETESQHVPVNQTRARRIFVFNAHGRAISMSVLDSWRSVQELIASANTAFMEPSFNILGQSASFVHAYFYPSMADLEDLEDIRDGDSIVVVVNRLEPGQMLNSLGAGRARSASLSMSGAVPASPRGAARPDIFASGAIPTLQEAQASARPMNGRLSESEWSHIVPFVEPSFYPSTLTFESHTSPETERFSVDAIKAAMVAHVKTSHKDHIQSILNHIESFACAPHRMGLGGSSVISTQPIHGSYTGEHRRGSSASGNGSSFSNSFSSLPVLETLSTPRGGIAVPTSYFDRGYSPNTSSPLATMSRSLVTLPSQLSGTGHDTSDSDSLGEVPSVSLNNASATQHPSTNQQQQRHAYEWERSENEIRALAAAHITIDKWEERDKLKRERSRHLTVDEERLAKKMEKRQSKVKVTPQRTVAALSTMPSRRPDSPSRSNASSLENQFAGPDEIVMDASGKVIGLTIDRLIQRLTSDSFPAVALAKSFLQTYRLYLSSYDLVSLLEARWDADGPPPPAPGAKLTPQQAQQQLSGARLRLLTLIKQWAFKHSDDFKDPMAKSAFFTFAAKMEHCGVSNIVKELEGAMFRARGSIPALVEKDMEEVQRPLSYTPPLGGELIDFHPLELARQITLLEKGYLDAIQPHELMNVAWTKKTKEVLAPNVMTMIRFSNFLVDWMCTEILKPTDAFERAVVINRFIYVGHYCMELNNFNASVEVLSALRRSSVYRLKRSWNLLSDRAWNVFEQMELLFEPDANYKNYRSVVEKVSPPVIPYVGRLLSDILFLEEKEPNMLNTSDMVNMVKLEGLGGLLRFVTDSQHHDYRFAPVEVIISYLYSQEVLNEKQAYSISLEREKKSVEAPKRPSEPSPSALVLEDCATRAEILAQFKAYLDSKCDSELINFFKQTAEWVTIVKEESDQSKRVRDLALLIFEAHIADRSDQQIPFAKDAFNLATIQEIEWKIKEESMPLPATLFKPLVDSVLPVLRYHFNHFKRALPMVQQPST